VRRRAAHAAHHADSSAPASENVSGVRTKKSEMWMAGLASRNTTLPRGSRRQRARCGRAWLAAAWAAAWAG